MQDIEKQIVNLEQELKSLKQTLKIQDKKSCIEKLQLKMSEPGFWGDSRAAAEVVAELKNAKGDVDGWEELDKRLFDLKELIDLSDSSLEADITQEQEKLQNGTTTSRSFISCKRSRNSAPKSVRMACSKETTLWSDRRISPTWNPRSRRR